MQLDSSVPLSRINFIETQASQAFQKATSLEGKVMLATTSALGADTKANAALKSEDTTQKLLKELIQEIKDLREEGGIQQKQIEQLRKEMDEYKEVVNNKISQLYQYVFAKNVPMYKQNSWGGWDLTCQVNGSDSVTMHFDENGNTTGHTSITNTAHYSDIERVCGPAFERLMKACDEIEDEAKNSDE